LSGAPLVYFSLGSQIYYQPALFRRVIDALAGRDVQLVISTAELELSPLPENVIAVRYAPQLAILKRARVLITHGGANSVMEALAFGVPLLLNPLCNDQFHQLHFVEKAGVGRRLPEGDPWPAIAELLADGVPRMREVSASYQVDGAAETARLLSALA
jgi:MGT family glycosyltransferase